MIFSIKITIKNRNPFYDEIWYTHPNDKGCKGMDAIPHKIGFPSRENQDNKISAIRYETQ
jgi:hypothetical protein